MLSVDELNALRYLSEGRCATHWVAKACGYGKDTAKGRRLLKRLEKKECVVGIPYSNGRVYAWRITDKGLAGLAASGT